LSQVEFLLAKNGLDVNAASEGGNTALHLTVSNGHEDFVRTLLERPNLDVNKRDDFGFTALHRAIIRGQPRALEILLEQENFITIGGTETGAETTNPATNDGDTGCLNQSINANVTNPWVSPSGTDLARTENLAPMPTLNRRVIDVNATDYLGRTALHLAVEKLYVTMVEMLLGRADINIHIADNKGETPLEAGRRISQIVNVYSESEKQASVKIVAMLERKMSRGMIGTAV
jgi:ankyrin repeat protein